jgi:cation channel sperm-associated protein subunit beta
MMYRPLLVVSQSNPEVLRISSKFSRKFDRQTLQVLLKPTGVKQGVSSFVIRSQVSSISCSSPSSFTFVVQCVRTEGRRLLITYPKTVDESEILAEGKPVVVNNQEIYKVLPTNYRPPSTRGVSVPLTTNVYNADPSKPMYQSWYKISKEKAEFKKCFMQSSREFCGCSIYDKLSDDPIFSDCKEKVYVATREEDLNISISYPPRLPDREQLQEYFSHTPRISVFIKEINGREDYSIRNKQDELHQEINKDTVISMGEKFYSGEPLTIKLHGTGLYHFKAELGRFHSFNEVTGYFILYSDTNDLDDVMLIMIVILTMTVCFVLVFFGFLRVRHRLVSHLPIRVEPLKTKTA